MVKIMFMLFLVLLEIFNGVSSEETGGDFGITQPTEEYLQVFKNIPKLFEFLIDSLQEKPEILEKDDITIFRNDDKGVSKRSLSNEVFYETQEANEIPEDGTIKEEVLPKRRIKRGHSVDDGDQLIDNSILKKDGNFLTMTGMSLRLSPDEVAQQAIKVEDMLEEHNKSRRP